jgi:hypothetical protein
MSEEEKKIAAVAKGEFMTILGGRWNSESGGWQTDSVSNYIKEESKIFQCRIFGRKVLEENVYEQMNHLFENTVVATHSEQFRKLNKLMEPSWK